MKELRTIAGLIFDFVFPRKRNALRIGALSTHEFLTRAPRSDAPLGPHLHAVFEYADPLVRTAIRALKYEKSEHAAALLAEGLYEELVEKFSEASVLENFTSPLIVAVPLSKKRKRDRGYNQVDLVLTKLKDFDLGADTTYISPLIRKRDTKSQTSLSRKKRLENVRGCFALRDNDVVQGRNVILVDDVITTGATMNEAERVLLEGGARAVFCVALAH